MDIETKTGIEQDGQKCTQYSLENKHIHIYDIYLISLFVIYSSSQTDHLLKTRTTIQIFPTAFVTRKLTDREREKDSK